jgi:hypothetical protein
MVSHKRLALLLSICLITTSIVCGQQHMDRSLTRAGALVGGNAYHNPVLGITLVLPGTWQLFDKATQRNLGINSNQAKNNSGCQGPLCGEPEIDIALITKPDQSHVASVFLSAYKLASPYLDRSRYPLRNFAEIMTTGSLSGSGLVPIGGLQSVQLDGKPSYRLLVGRPGEDVTTGFGYVGEAQGYIFLLVGSVSSAKEAPKLQSAIESMTFDRASR